MLMNKEKLDKVKMIANNALYFADNSDYKTALWEILATVKPYDFLNDDIPILKYIEDKEQE